MKNTWYNFLEYFIKYATVKPEHLRISLGSLNNIVSQRKICDDFERFFTIYTITDPETKEILVLCPRDKYRLPGLYCGSLKKEARKIIGKLIIESYQKYINNDISEQINFLVSLRQHPLILDSERAKETLEKLIAKSGKIEKLRTDSNSIQGIVNEVVNSLIRPVLLGVGQGLKEDNLFSYRDDKEFILMTLQDMVEDSQGINNLIGKDSVGDNGIIDYFRIYL